jgi:hypothetical protein
MKRTIDLVAIYVRAIAAAVSKNSPLPTTAHAVMPNSGIAISV